MPRLSPRLLRIAYNIDPLLASLLRECRNLRSAQNELRWLREHARTQAENTRTGPERSLPRAAGWRALLQRDVHQRSHGKPLQYIIGNQPFGELEILSEPGVLIPRPETETYVTKLCHAIEIQMSLEVTSDSPIRYNVASDTPLRILDLCTGTGCISLLAYSLLAKPLAERGIGIEILGIDIDKTALDLARRNLEHNINNKALPLEASENVKFLQADVLAQRNSRYSVLTKIETLYGPNSRWDILISNPPYISQRDYDNGTVSQSVKKYEPKLALVPPQPATRSNSVEYAVDIFARPEDTFYEALVWHSRCFESHVVLLECGDQKQADNIVQMGRQVLESSAKTPHNEIWEDGSTRAVVFWQDSIACPKDRKEAVSRSRAELTQTPKSRKASSENSQQTSG